MTKAYTPVLVSLGAIGSTCLPYTAHVIAFRCRHSSYFSVTMLSRSDDVSQQQDPIVIAVMGPTGTGKSSFIKRLTGARDIVIGHGVTSGWSRP